MLNFLHCHTAHYLNNTSAKFFFIDLGRVCKQQLRVQLLNWRSTLAGNR